MVMLQLVVVLLFLAPASAQSHPHQPQWVTWAVISAGNGETLNSTTREVIPQTWWPDLYFDLCDLARGSWDVGDWTPLHKGRPECRGLRGCNLPQVSNPQHPGCSHVLKRAALRDTDFYVCPGSNRTATDVSKCGGAETYYCAQWGCEMTGTGSWIKHKGHIIVQRVPLPRLATNPLYGRCTSYLCNPVKVTFTEEGRRVTDWEAGRMWGLRLYQTGYDQGLLFSIRRSIQPIQGP